MAQCLRAILNGFNLTSVAVVCRIRKKKYLWYCHNGDDDMANPFISLAAAFSLSLCMFLTELGKIGLGFSSFFYKKRIIKKYFSNSIDRR